MDNAGKQIASSMAISRYISFDYQGIYFTFAGIASVLYATQSTTLLSTTATTSSITLLTASSWILYEISFPIAFLVSLVVSFVLIPMAKIDEIPVDVFFHPLPCIMHNANIFFMTIEFLLNDLHFFPTHVIFVLLYGIAYVFFAWYWHRVKGIYYYFFLDYTRPLAVFFYLGLLFLCAMLFVTGYYCNEVKARYDGVLGRLVSVH